MVHQNITVYQLCIQVSLASVGWFTHPLSIDIYTHNNMVSQIWVLDKDSKTHMICFGDSRHIFSART